MELSTQRIAAILRASGKKPMSLELLMNRAKLRSRDKQKIKELLTQMQQSGEVMRVGNRYLSTQALHYRRGEVMTLHRTFGLIKDLDSDQQYFIAGRLMQGAMPGDQVIFKKVPGQGDLPEGEIIEIFAESTHCFAATVIEENGCMSILPDQIRIAFGILPNPDCKVQIGDKVLARIAKRGKRHFDHKASVVRVFGSADNADICSQAILAENDIPLEFPDAVLEQARTLAGQSIHPKEIEQRLDLRDEIIFTIDSADSKDLDDAISIKQTEQGWELGVHIADVSFYVQPGRPLDQEAFLRGTSIYYADRVIPMLPPELSNGICSLNPGEDRLTFSALLQLDSAGKLLEYRFEKSVIRSRVKGVYKEVNAILNDTADSELLKKYDGLVDSIFLMQQLANRLTQRRFGRGGLDIESTESKILFDENHTALEIVPRTRGESERIIEEFMLVANQAAASSAMQGGFPFVYRVHEDPSEEKIRTLSEVLHAIGIPAYRLTDKVTPIKLAKILEAAKETQYARLVNNLLLRSLAKAKYSETNVGHFGLVLKNYAHFTSPIRRYPDLAIHRILNHALIGMSERKLHSRYEPFVKEAAAHSSATEQRAVRIERSCEDCYKAEYMKKHIGEERKGIIVSVANHGFYVELENSAEGLVKIDSLPEGEYCITEHIAIIERYSNRSYRVGDSVTVRIENADISAGTVDFTLA